MHDLIANYIKTHKYNNICNINTNVTAVIVENRPIKHLDWVISNIRYHTKFNVIHIKDINMNSIESYNELLTSKSFWEKLPENILIFQSDSFMLKDWNAKFEKYDYIGAPWKWAYTNNRYKLYQDGGNGGISFRKSSKMLEIIDKYPPNKYLKCVMNPLGNEDMYFSLHLRDTNSILPNNLIIQKQFSTETIYYKDTMCVHAIDKWLTNTEIKNILDNND